MASTRPDTSAWVSLGLSPWLAEACRSMGLSRPTPIQLACVGPALAGRDVLGSAETGSGKTAAFALPILQALSEDPYGVFAVVLSPARELASQIADQFVALGARMQLRTTVVVGGVDMMHQALALAERPHVVVGTPGRLADHMRSNNTALTMRNARFLVIDEADRLLEMGFADDLATILGALPSRRQTLLFSATMSGALKRLQRLALTEPHVADLAPLERIPAALKLEYVFVPANVRDAYLIHMLRTLVGERETAMVFTSTCRACEVLACTLRALSVDCAPLHSQQPQARRLAAIGRFKQGSLRLLVCTDVAARGIDIPQVSLVINHNVPAMPRDLVHRCGRTARAGRSGRAITLVSQYDVEVLLATEEAVGRKMESLELDEPAVLAVLHEVASARRTAMLELTDNGFLEKEKERKAERKAARLDAAGDEEHLEGSDEDGAADEGGNAESKEADEDLRGSTQVGAQPAEAAAGGGGTKEAGARRRGDGARKSAAGKPRQEAIQHGAASAPAVLRMKEKRAALDLPSARGSESGGQKARKQRRGE